MRYTYHFLWALPLYTLLMLAAAVALYFMPETKLLPVAETDIPLEWEHPVEWEQRAERIARFFNEDGVHAKEEFEQSGDWHKLDSRQFPFTGKTLSLVASQEEKDRYRQFDIFIKREKGGESRIEVDCYTTEYVLCTPETFDFTDTLKASEVTLVGNQLLFTWVENEIQLEIFQRLLFVPQFEPDDKELNEEVFGRSFVNWVYPVNSCFYLTLPEGVEIQATGGFNIRESGALH